MFKKYNSIDLIKVFSGLSLIPQNHGKYVRLEELAMQALLGFNQNEATVSNEELQQFLIKYYSTHHLEDPETNLFTDLVTFKGGDYLIFPGISDGGSYVLSNLLTAIYQWPEPGIALELKRNCWSSTILILRLSNMIAKRLGLHRYQEGLVEDESIYFPTETNLERLKDAISKPEERMIQLLEKEKISIDTLKKFVCEIEDISLIEQFEEESPLVIKPIIYFNAEYIIASPSTLSYSLVNTILTEARAIDNISSLSKSYHDFIWNNLQLQLRQLGFETMAGHPDMNFLDAKNREGIYRFDDDKLAFIQLLTGGETQHQERKQRIIDSVISQPLFASHKFMDITLVSSMGRDLFFLFEMTNNSKSIGMPIYDFISLANLREHSAIDLWKCVIASEEKISSENQMISSFLDVFKLFKDNDDSFYISDTDSSPIPLILPGYASSYYQDAKLIIDEHSVIRSIGGKMGFLPVVRRDKYEPVYYSNGDFGKQLWLLVEGYSQPIWITPSKNIMEVEKNASGVYFKIADAIAFWLWQCQEYLQENLTSLENLPITIYFELFPEERFNPIARGLEKDPLLSEQFRVESKGYNFLISIPHTIIPYLNAADNEGERVLLSQLINGLNQILSAMGKEVIDEGRIKYIIEKVAPLGQKKKVFFMDTAKNLLLDPTNLIDVRYIKNYDINQILDSLKQELGKLCPPVGKKLNKKEKTKLTRDIVLKVLLPKLESSLSRYDNETLLQRLYSLNESLIWNREKLKITTPTRIACFSSFEKEAIELHESLSKLNQTSIAVRCLIEHLAAEPSTGDKIVSTTALDELIALMSAIIDWGSLGDQINFDLFEIEMEILPSGRVGTKKELFKEVFDPYYSSKSTENIEDALDAFEQAFEPYSDDGEDVPKNLDNAFNDEFGLSFTRICEFINDLGIIAYRMPTAFASLSKNDVIIEVNKLDHNFTLQEFENAFKYLSLSNRGKVRNVPEGFDNIDISPWRFNRRLSLIRKPIVALDNKEDPDNPTFYWGFRQLLASRIYLYDQCVTNRLRVPENGAIQKALGKIAQSKGKRLVESVLKELGYSHLIVDSEVFIGPNSPLKNEKDIGDIDVLIIDQTTKNLYSIECKSLAPSRNIKEMIEEVSKLFGSDSNQGLLDKHNKRDLWLKSNLELVGKKYALDLSEYSVKSVFLTQEDMLSPYLKNTHLPIPMITLYDLKRKGIKSLD
jgi:hypothetical protein